ncbi:MAG: DUF1631 family protein [Pseudomonadales bacterium]|nr:DUF1631 family protein [Pseudomonadales bacterium]
MENRRSSVRRPIQLSALAHPQRGRSWLCNVRDFCEEGMFLVGAGGHRLSSTAGSAFAPRSVISLHFSVATREGISHFRNRATVVRVGDDGTSLGIRFADRGLDPAAFQALVQFAVAAGMAEAPAGDDAGEAESSPDYRLSGELPEAFLRDRRINERDAARLRARVRTVTQRAVERIAANFLRNAQDTLLARARDAGTNAVQLMYFEGLDLLERQDSLFRTELPAQLLVLVERVPRIEEVLEKRRRRQTGESGKLALVDTETFEEWLLVTEIIAKTEQRFAEELLDLRALMGLLARPWSHKDVLPVGPATMMWVFDDVLRGFDLRRQVREDLLRTFEETLVPVLSLLYTALLKVLTESGAFPSIEEIRRKLQSSAIRRTSSGVKIDPAAYQKMDSATRAAAMAADGVGAGRVNYNPFQPTDSSGQKIYSTARNLLGLRRRTRERLGQELDELLAGPGTSRADLLAREEILDAMTKIQAEVGDGPVAGRRLRARLVDILKTRHGGAKLLSEEDFDTLELMEHLVDSIAEDRLITDGIREWISRLEVTLNKLATRDPEFLRPDGEQPHSAVQMINQLARLGNARDVREGIDREVGSRVDELLQRVVREYDDNPQVIEEVVDELHPLLDRQSQSYRGNVERTIRASEGQQKLARARRTVLEQLAARLEGRDVPKLLLELLNPGWRNLLVHTFLKHGAASAQWRDQLAIVDQLFGQMCGTLKPQDAAFVNPDELLKRVVEGLNSISFDPGRRTPLVMKLSAAIVGDTAGLKAPVAMEAVPPAAMEKLLSFEGLLPELNPEADSDEEAAREDFDRALTRVRRIQVGEWLATSDVDGRPLILTVAFVGDANSSFVLVNRRGVKNRELSLKEMAQSLHDGKITLLEDFDLPLMERASQRMLENMHSQLAYQASHDELTNLLNRKEFERAVDSAIASARRKDDQHALLYLDLDQFKIINNTSGHTAGDELLKMVGLALGELMKRSRAGVARLGGDEFGVLLNSVTTAEARQQAETVLSTIRSQRFAWQGRSYSLSASVGLVFIDQSTESVDAVMQYADEACYAAKDAGRNRIKEYELGDAHMLRRRGVMEWVAELDKALNENRLILNCQRIASIEHPQRRVEGHYEILLTMRDELGEVMPPADFILAAETYNRMTAIDRWVIERVLTWLADHRSRLDHFGGFSINVSGHSVNDETFPDFVLEQFSRTQAPTSKVCFEITETAAIANLDNAVEFMSRMKIIGCRFSLDDFGTGLSSYSYLRNLPVDYVKIDGVFVKDIITMPGDQAVVRSINEIGHYMGKKTIAEYVENQAIFDALKEIGVDYAQGYCIEKPTELSQLVL